MNTDRREKIFARLRELGAEPKRSLGQNFLVSDVVISRILMAVNSQPFSEMVEVGPGLGALTDDLLAIGKPLLLLELDQKFAAYWRGRAETSTTPLQVREGDALQLDWRELNLPENSLFVSNLPYQISSSIVIERSVDPAHVGRMILMFQKEVAQRLAARAKTKEYGLLTVVAQTFWEISTVCDAGPKDFFPPPNVASRVMQFRRRPTPWLADAGESQGPTAAGFLKFAKAAFSHRRKLMSRNLQQEFFGGNKEILGRLEEIFLSQGLKTTARAEELDPPAFVRLYLAVRQERESLRGSDNSGK